MEEKAMSFGPIILGELTDPEAIARFWAGHEKATRNGEWLQSHWPDLLPQALGKFVAVAGQEAFIADTPQEAWAKANAAHPEDEGAICQYVRPERGPRIYAHCGPMVSGQ
jgi:hypothetical protein